LITNQGDVAVIIDSDTQNNLYISAFMDLNSRSPSSQDISYSYLTACDASVTKIDPLSTISLTPTPDMSYTLCVPSVISSQFTFSPVSSFDTMFQSLGHSISMPPTLLVPITKSNSALEQVSTFAAKRKYKPVALKTRPVITDLPNKFHIVRNIVGDPLADMPTLTPTPPTFVPTG